MAVKVKSCGGGGLSSSDVTASSAQVLAGYSTLTTDSNDEVMQGSIQIWNGEKYIPDYLCFTANTSGSTVTCPKTFEYSTDGVLWNTASTSSAIILSSAGNKIYVRNGNVGVPSSSLGKFVMSGSISASGNVMSLVDNSCQSLTIPCDRCFNQLFSSCTALTTAPKFPATTLKEYCYSATFANCTSLKTPPPELPAEVLQPYCYHDMFLSCNALNVAPKISASTLADHCCTLMFFNCSSLKTPPQLTATVLDNYCYWQMFENCTSLTSVPKLPATTLKDSCYEYMFHGCTALQISEYQTPSERYVWKLPTTGTFTNTKNQESMFGRCIGTRDSDDMPGVAGQSYTYYTLNQPV